MKEKDGTAFQALLEMSLMMALEQGIGMILIEIYSSLFLIAKDRDTMVADYLENSNGCFLRNLLFIRQVYNQGLEDMVQLQDDLHTKELYCQEEDTLEQIPQRHKDLK